MNTKKRKRPKEERTTVPRLYHGIFMLKSNVDTSIELDTIMCANWLIDWLLKVQQAIFQSYSGWEKFVNNDLTRELVFLSLPTTSWSYFYSPGFRRVTGDPAIVAFYDKRIYKKLRLKELSLSDPFYHGK